MTHENHNWQAHLRLRTIIAALLLLAAGLLVVGAASARASTAITIEGKVPGSKAKIECTSARRLGRRESGSFPSASTVTISGCSVPTEPICKLDEPIALQAETQVVEVSGSLYEKLTPAKNSTRFAVLHLSNCVIEGKFNLAGGLASPTSKYEGGRTVGAPLSFSAANDAAVGVSPTLAGNSATVTGSAGGFLAVEGNGAKGSPVPLKWSLGLGGTPFPTYGETPKISGGPVEIRSAEVHGLSVTCQSQEAVESQLGGSGEHLKLKFSGCTAPEHPTLCYPTLETLTTSVMAGTTVGFAGQVHQVLTPSGSEPVITIPLGNCSSSYLRLKGSLGAREGSIGTPAVAQPLAFSPYIDLETGAALIDQFGSGGSIRGVGTMELIGGSSFGAS